MLGRTHADPYRARRVLLTGIDLLSVRAHQRLTAVFGEAVHGDDHIAVEATWGIYQRMITPQLCPNVVPCITRDTLLACERCRSGNCAITVAR